MQRTLTQFVAPYADVTRPEDTTQYGAGDVIADSASAASVLVFPRCSSDGGRGGCIRSAMLVDSSAEATKLNADLFLFNAEPESYGNDNEAFAPTDAEMLTCVAVIALDGTTAANLSIGNGNVVIQNKTIAIPFVTALTDTSLYGVLVARNTYTPVSAEAFRVRLGIEQG